MNETQYRSLCEACDHVLMVPGSTIERVAITWLHIIREHPVFLANYADLFKPVTDTRVLGNWLWRVLRNRAGWCRQLIRALRSDGQLWFGSKELPQQVDVLFVSHFLNESHAGKSVDFYYGNLPSELGTHGYSAAIALINHSNKPVEAVVRRWKKSDVLRVILSGSLGIVGELEIHRRLKREASVLRKLAKTEALGLRRRVLVRAAQEAQSSSSRATLRIGIQIRELAGKLRPKVIVVTHEGHAWERVVFAAARSAAPGVRCIAYQHAAIFRLQHAIRRNLTRNYNPDQILTAGTTCKTQLEYAPGIEGIPISVLGSNRSLMDVKTNGASAIDQSPGKQADNPACLVLPEGLASECHILFEFSLACAHTCPEVQFIWRLHPVMSFESFVVQYPKLRNLPKNVELSCKTFEEDLARSRWALYRGTTAVLQAVVVGLRPIYLQLQDELTIDPLYDLGEWRAMITIVSEFQKIIRNDTGTHDWPVESEICEARRYSQSYYMPYDVHALTALIQK